MFTILTIYCTTGYSQGIVTSSNTRWSIITARTVGKGDGKPVSGVNGYLSVPGNIFQFAVDVSDDDGNLRFLIKTPRLPVPVVIQVDRPEIQLTVLKQDSAVLGNFSFDSIPGAPERNADTLPFYGMPDKRYVLDEYTRFATLEEILIEYVSEVRIRKNDGKVGLEVLNTPFQSFFSTPPLVILDGIPVFNMEQLVAISPLQVQKVEVVARKYYLGPLIWTGIVSFTTYDGGFAGYQLPSSAMVIE